MRIEEDFRIDTGANRQRSVAIVLKPKSDNNCIQTVLRKARRQTNSRQRDIVALDRRCGEDVAHKKPSPEPEGGTS
jgi:hypothetical protein